MRKSKASTKVGSASAPKVAVRRGKSKPLTVDDVRAIALALPGMEERSCYGTPGFYLRGKFLARLHQDGESLVLKMDQDSRAFLTRAKPEVYYFTEHYRNYPAVLIRFGQADRAALEEHFEDVWRSLASKRQIADYESQSRSSS